MESKSSLVIGGNDSMDPIYSDYLKTRDMESLLKKLCGTTASRNYRSGHNALERWLMSSIHGSKLFESNDDIDNLFISELVKSKAMNQAKAARFLHSIKDLIHVSRQVSTSRPVAKVHSSQVEIQYQSFRHRIPKERYDTLIKKGTLDQITCSLMKYMTLLPSGQQWCIPRDRYREYVKDGATIEGFSSPFNSQLLMIDSDLRFCSMFKDLDSVFGSLGSFFDNEFENQYVIVNPPFIETILEDATMKCIECMNRYKCRFVFWGPNWTDSPFYSLLEGTEWTIKKEVLKSGTYSYEDLIHGNGLKDHQLVSQTNCKQIPAMFDSVIFTLEH